MTSHIFPEPRKKPKQARAVHAVAAIEQACLKILEEEGPRHLTTNRIAEMAGVNIASLYQYFPNKEAIVAAVYAAKLATDVEASILEYRPKLATDVEADVLETRGIENVANGSLEDALRVVIQGYVALSRRFSRLNAEFYGRYSRFFDLLTYGNKQAAVHGLPLFEEWFPTLLERHRARLRVVDLPLASLLAIRAMEGALRFAVEERPDLLESAAFQEELLALLLGFLEARRA
jgi:AcrR family transcriptional regulator